MTDPAADRRTPVAVAIDLADAPLAAALAAAIDGDPAFCRVAAANADIVVTDDAAAARHRGQLVLIGGAFEMSEIESAPEAVRAILPEATSARMVLAAVELVAAGLFVFPGKGFEEPGDPAEAEPSRAPGNESPQLTPREAEVLQLLAAGASNKLIARRLGVSVHTAKFHVASLTRKLGATSRLDAVGIGVRSGLVMA